MAQNTSPRKWLRFHRRSFLLFAIQIAIATLIFAYLIEFLQFLNLIDRLGWRNSQLAHLTIGSTFDWRDLVAYTIGIAIVLLTTNRLKP